MDAVERKNHSAGKNWRDELMGSKNIDTLWKDLSRKMEEEVLELFGVEQEKRGCYFGRGNQPQ